LPVPALVKIPDDVLDAPVDGVNLAPGPLRAQLDPARPTLVVFLRHFGCIFCREMVKDVRKAAEANRGYPPVLFIFQGTPADGQRFFADHAPAARAVADHDRRLYGAFGLGQGSMAQMFSPRVWLCGLRATAKGNTIGVGRIIGDPWTMPGVFLLKADGTIPWQHDFVHAGDHPDFNKLPLPAGAAVA
jgi:hypothetical protein